MTSIEGLMIGIAFGLSRPFRIAPRNSNIFSILSRTSLGTTRIYLAVIPSIHGDMDDLLSDTKLYTGPEKSTIGGEHQSITLTTFGGCVVLSVPFRIVSMHRQQCFLQFLCTVTYNSLQNYSIHWPIYWYYIQNSKKKLFRKYSNLPGYHISHQYSQSNDLEYNFGHVCPDSSL